MDIPSYCKSNPSAVLPDPSNCGRYFNCGDPTSHYRQECVYPQLFSDQSMHCDDFQSVLCGQRSEPQAPCKYMRLIASVVSMYELWCFCPVQCSCTLLLNEFFLNVFSSYRRHYWHVIFLILSAYVKTYCFSGFLNTYYVIQKQNYIENSLNIFQVIIRWIIVSLAMSVVFLVNRGYHHAKVYQME